MVNYLLYMAMPVILRPIVATAYHGQSINSKDSIRKRYLTLCGIVIFLMFALRHYSVGSGDGEWYYRNWDYLSNISFDKLSGALNHLDIEQGYTTVIWALSHIFSHPQFLFVLYGALVAISICVFLYRYCEELEVALVMFNCLGLFSFMVQGIRQGIAMCICLFAVEFCIKRKLIPFIFLVVLAMLFHASAVVFVVMYFLPILKIDVKSMIAFAICTFAGITVLDRLLHIGNTIINDSYSRGDTELTSGGYITALIYIMIIVAAVIMLRGDEVKDTAIRLFFYMTLCGFVVFMLRYSINTIFQRLGYFFMFGQLIMLPKVISKFKGKNNFIARIIVVLLCLGIIVYKSRYSVLIPYTFFWQV